MKFLKVLHQISMSLKHLCACLIRGEKAVPCDRLTVSKELSYSIRLGYVICLLQENLQENVRYPFAKKK